MTVFSRVVSSERNRRQDPPPSSFGTFSEGSLDNLDRLHRDEGSSDRFPEAFSCLLELRQERRSGLRTLCGGNAHSRRRILGVFNLLCVVQDPREEAALLQRQLRCLRIHQADVGHVRVVVAAVGHVEGVVERSTQLRMKSEKFFWSVFEESLRWLFRLRTRRKWIGGRGPRRRLTRLPDPSIDALERQIAARHFCDANEERFPRLAFFGGSFILAFSLVADRFLDDRSNLIQTQVLQAATEQRDVRDEVRGV